jgi:hypothetical protein
VEAALPLALALLVLGCATTTSSLMLDAAAAMQAFRPCASAARLSRSWQPFTVAAAMLPRSRRCFLWSAQRLMFNHCELASL